MKKPVALITGSSRGIGRSTAKLFVQRGYAVAVHCHNSRKEAEELLQELQSIHPDVCLVQADISKQDQVKEMIASVEETLGEIDVLVNNAGIAEQKLFTDLTAEEWRHMFAVNMDSMFFCCQAVLPSMIHKKSGSIVNLSSMWGQVGASCEVHYSASKAAVIGFTKALAKELGPSGIRVNCVAPGVIATDMNSSLTPETTEQLKEETPLNTIGSPEEIAKAIFFLSSSQASSFITGQILGVNGGFII